MTQKCRCAAFVLAAMVFVWVNGCGPTTEPPPKVFPVKGVVKAKGAALKGGMIEFRLESNPTFAMSSAIGDNGAFELHTLFGNQKLQGAAAGACKVSVYSISSTGELISRELVQPRQPITIAEKANELTIEVE